MVKIISFFWLVVVVPYICKKEVFVKIAGGEGGPHRLYLIIFVNTCIYF